jgi:hypothetical protein
MQIDVLSFSAPHRADIASDPIQYLPILANERPMSYVNPITGSILQTDQVQRQEATNKDREARRQAQLKKGLSELDEAMEEQVESTETVINTDDDHKNPQEERPPSKRKKKDDEEPHLDLRA